MTTYVSGTFGIQAATRSPTQFFPDARLNYAENLLRRNDDAPAILFCREDGLESSMSWAELHENVSRAQRRGRNGRLRSPSWHGGVRLHAR